MERAKKTEGMARRLKHYGAGPPDGGWGWMIVAACFITTICTRAVARCVSIFFVEFRLEFSGDFSETAWIHSLVDCSTMLCAPLGSYIGNHLSCRLAVIVGGLLSSLGLVLSSFATSLEYLYVSLGMLTGVGSALCYTPAIAMVGAYFSERKALAYGIAMSGSGIGTFILAPVVQLLIDLYSWRGALLILGGIVSHLCACGALMRPLKDYCQMHSVKEMGLEMSVLNTTIADTNLCKEVYLENEKASKETDLVGLGGVVQNDNGELAYDKLEQKAEMSREADEEEASERNTHSQQAEQTDSKLAKPLLTPSKLANSKLCDMTISCDNHRRTAQEESKEKDVCDYLSCTQEYSFLLMPEFLILAASLLFLAFGCTLPFVYLVPYSLSVGVSHQQGALLMSILGAMGIVGNITFGWISDRKCLRAFRMVSYVFAVALEGLTCLFVPLVTSFPLLVPFSLLYGYFDGAYVALMPVVTSDSVGSAHLSAALGVVYFLHAIPFLISPPIGGWLLDLTSSYTSVFLLSGFSIICSASILAAFTLTRHCSRRCSQVRFLQIWDEASQKVLKTTLDHYETKPGSRL